MPILLMIVVVVIYLIIVINDSDTPKPTYRADAIYATNTQVAVWWRQTLTAQVETTPNDQTKPPVLRLEVDLIKRTENAIRATNIYILEFTQKTQTAQAVTKTKLPTATPTMRQPEVETIP